MTRYDVFNGDADGLCALQQLRLAFPADAVLVTGTKRDVRLLERVPAQRGDTVTVLDVSVEANRAALTRALDAGAVVEWFDHHYAGEPIAASNFAPHLDAAPRTCTSLIVDDWLGGRWRAWALVAAFGDNLHAEAERLARAEGYSDQQTRTLLELGQCLNYNAYGESVADLYFDPAELATRMRPYEDPFAFARDAGVLQRLQLGYADDMTHAMRAVPQAIGAHARAYFLPDENWARRVIGAFANGLAIEYPGIAHAVLAARPDGSFTVSVRAPENRPEGADELVRAFPTGGGRKNAAGIDRLPPLEVDAFLRALGARYGD
ncbi:MAG: DHH family phosphoesterase [Burkholderiales bacterium]|nr:DHH family phosphoesterase [Burkholderiales bacterium]